MKFYQSAEAVDRSAKRHGIPDLREKILREGGSFDGKRFCWTEKTLREVNPNHPALKRLNRILPVAEDVKPVSIETQQERRLICLKCPSEVYNEPQQKCAHPRCEVCLRSTKRIEPWKGLQRCAGGHW